MTILVVTPITEEVRRLHQRLADFGHTAVERTIGHLDAMEYDGGEIVLAQGGLGKAQFGVQTQHLIDNLDDISVIVCAGTCGRLDDTLSVGDVVVGTHTVEHDFNRGETLIKMPLPTFEGDAKRINALKELMEVRDFGFGVHFGGVGKRR